jgi:trehalose/maltose hydrolase-like predicted phosphorylase
LFQELDVEPRIPALIEAPDWLRFDLRVGGEPLELAAGEALTYRRVLDFRRGLLLGEWRQRTPGGHSRTELAAVFLQ